MRSAGHEFTINDLYKTNSPSCLDLIQYKREMSCVPESTVPEDVLHKQEKMQEAGALAYVYPVWWRDCPAILKGWFDSVWTNGFAQANNDNTRRSDINPKQALIICIAGHTLAHLETTGIAQSMRSIMVNDRLVNTSFTRCEVIIFGGTTSCMSPAWTRPSHLVQPGLSAHSKP